VPLDIAASVCQLDAFLFGFQPDPPRGRVRQFSDTHRFAALVAPRGRIAAIRNLVSTAWPCRDLVRRQHAVRPINATAALRTTAAGAVLQNVCLGAARKYPEPKPRSSPIPDEASRSGYGAVASTNRFFVTSPSRNPS